MIGFASTAIVGITVGRNRSFSLYRSKQIGLLVIAANFRATMKMKVGARVNKYSVARTYQIRENVTILKVRAVLVFLLSLGYYGFIMLKRAWKYATECILYRNVRNVCSHRSFTITILQHFQALFKIAFSAMLLNVPLFIISNWSVFSTNANERMVCRACMDLIISMYVQIIKLFK